jgi:Protein of unknown function (DUF4197)
MKKILFLIVTSTVITLSTTSCDPKTQEALLKTGTDILTAATTGTNTNSSILSNDDIIKGLKEALSVGTNNSASFASKLDGFNKNPLIFIPWPAEALAMKSKLIQLGFQQQITNFETSLNRAAEEATKEAAPIFVNAITKMSISDALGILNGSDTAATSYLRKQTYYSLRDKFSPIVGNAINKVNVTSYWTPLATTYNMLPAVNKVNPDLNAYVTNKAINGLMTLIAQEETKIRKDPMARVTDILKRVFGAKK